MNSLVEKDALALDAQCQLPANRDRFLDAPKLGKLGLTSVRLGDVG